MAAAGPVIVFMFLLVGTVIVSTYVLAYAAYCFLVVVQDTAAGIDEVIWPNEPVQDWLGEAVYLLALIAIWLAPAGILARALREDLLPEDGPLRLLVLAGPGLWLYFPIGLLSSTTGSGKANRHPLLFGTPEQTAPPQVLVRANQLANASHETLACPMHELRNDPDLLEAHLNNLPVYDRRIRGQVNPHLAIGRAKIEDAESFDEALNFLNSRETFAVLVSRASLEALLELPTPATDRGLEAIQA